MINVTALNALLTDNTDGKLFQRWFITTPNGSLVAYTTPADTRQLRDQAALVLVTWREQAAAMASDSDVQANLDSAPGQAPSRMHTMIMEFDNRNVLVRELQPKLLLVLEGGVPPGRSRKLQITTEGPDATRRFTGDDLSEQLQSGTNGDKVTTPRPGSPTGQSETSTTSHRRRTSVLDIHRKKLDALTELIRQDFATAQFTMPPDTDDRFF